MPQSVEAATASIEQPAADTIGNGDAVHKDTKVPEIAEVDEFGLPVKKRKASISAPTYLEEEVDSKQEQGDMSAPQPNGSIKPIGSESLEVEPSKENQAEKNGADSDSGDEEFKDAQSTPNPSQTPQPVPEPKIEPRSPRSPRAPIRAADDVAQEPKETTRELEIDPDEGKQQPLVADSRGPRTPGLKDVADVQEPKADSLPSGHARQTSSVGQGLGVSEWSHQQLAPTDEKLPEDDEGEWQTMPAFAPYDMYDDNNRLIAKEAAESDEEDDAYVGLGGAGKGYTRVQLDEDAQSATSLDENTQYLFRDVNGGTGAAEMDDEEQRDALSQMQATKDLLTEGQRIAYVGMTRLILTKMLDQVEVRATSRTGKKETQLSVEAMKMWSQKMMVRLYAHMEISTDEQVMIEQLSEHGVVPSDLTATLMQNARVKNPMAEPPASSTDLASPRPDSLHSSDLGSRRSLPSTPSTPRLPQTPGLKDEEKPAHAPPAYEEHEGEDLPKVRTPSQLPTTKNIDIDLRWTVLCDLFLTLIADSVYDARSRVLLERVGENMGVDWLEICRFEKRVTDALEMQQSAEKENWNEDGHKESRRKQALKKRYMMMGLATVGGSLVIGLSAGLLAPVIGAGLAAGFTTIGVAGTSGFLAGAGGAAIITSGAAASGGVIAVRAANRRTGAVNTFEYRPLHNNKRVNLIVTVSGWMTGKVDDVRLPYSTVDPIMGDIYSVLWEPEMLRSMGDTINILATEALTQGLQQVLGSTILISLMAALQLPVVLTKLSYLIDNPWTVSQVRADAAGLILADSLIDRNLGTRPITFVGYSLGSRVIFSCLKELSKRGAYGLVQNVFLFGSPVVAKREEYLKARSVVAGRFVNGFAKNDWILGYLFRLTSGGISRVAGLAPIEDVPEIENMDVTEFVPGHMSYRTAMPRLLREVGWVVESDEFTEIEDPDPENHSQRQRELINEIEEARKEFEKQEKEKEAKGKFSFFSRKKKEIVKKQDWETYQESRPETTSGGSQSNNDELKSTLPPMKLDINSGPSSLRTSLRETKSYDSVTMLKSENFRSISSASPRISNSETFLTTKTPSYNIPQSSYHNNYEEDDIQMTFDEPTYTPSQPPSTITSTQHLPRIPSPLPSPIPSPGFREPNSQRPDLKASTTMPAAVPQMNPGHNAWADDDDEFGSEKGIQMSFA
ncbi:hypothetical protein BJ875DRAFT_502132 [Amylocarpus encephaloides]|uniref:DUF726-domain-containing protein n=1 Tax=Amylocarpus encephaloides TaxID=45428 RepID=A0A9P7YRE3_9HELO|nr:hypothetical protein BJ875DRAFT_502132 [Amylocarpus encephaloides]